MTHDFDVFFSVEFEKNINFLKECNWSLKKRKKKPKKCAFFKVFLHFFHSSCVYSKIQYFFHIIRKKLHRNHVSYLTEKKTIFLEILKVFRSTVFYVNNK